MWVQWVKKSSSARVHTRSPTFADTFHHNQTSPFYSIPSSPKTPIHKHSISFKDVESLLTDNNNNNNNNNNSPIYLSSPLHKQSLYFKEPAGPAHPSPARKQLSLKDVGDLVSDPARQARPGIFHRVRAWASRQAQQPPPDSNNKVVVYYTSLRVVRRTFEDCRAVRSILKGYRVRMDERDLSMDGSYVEELEKVVGMKRDKVVKMLPRVFVNGKCVGGVEEVKRLHESGELKSVLKEVPKEEVKKLSGGNFGGCSVCGGCRYVVCEYCDGSHKVFDGNLSAWKSCLVCNVNGLVKCPCCTSVVF